MKYIILIGDGMADLPIAELKGKTPLEHAGTPNMDYIAQRGEMGLFKSVPEGLPPGSDVSNMSILGYEPKLYYTGRAPLEAASMAIRLGPEDVALRCNLVTLSKKNSLLIMEDYSAGHISSDEAKEIISAVNSALASDAFRFHAGKSYRHLMVWKGGSIDITTTPPHDISGKAIDDYLPKGAGSDKLVSLIRRSQLFLKDHPVNIKRAKNGKKRADSIWLWGQGKSPEIPSFKERFGINGAIISAVDLMNGLGKCIGLQVINVPGITGWLDTDYNAKVTYALKTLEEKDLVCVHVEAPDEAGHQGSLEYKLRAIEDFDKKVVGPVLEGMKHYKDYKVMVITDHPTPIALKTHTSEPVPYAIYRGKGQGAGEGATISPSPHVGGEEGKVGFMSPPAPATISPSPHVGGEGRGEGGFSEREAKEKGVLKKDPRAFMKAFLGG